MPQFDGVIMADIQSLQWTAYLYRLGYSMTAGEQDPRAAIVR